MASRKCEAQVAPLDINSPHYCGRLAAWVAVCGDGSEVELCAQHKHRARAMRAVEIKPVEVSRWVR